MSQVSSLTWRLGSTGAFFSTSEEFAAFAATSDKESIYFFADLGASSKVTHDEDTLHKVREALGTVGLSEKQTMDALNAILNKGLVFRERV